MARRNFPFELIDGFSNHAVDNSAEPRLGRTVAARPELPHLVVDSLSGRVVEPGVERHGKARKALVIVRHRIDRIEQTHEEGAVLV
jgi:hypothetical protein